MFISYIFCYFFKYIWIYFSKNAENNGFNDPAVNVYRSQPIREDASLIFKKHESKKHFLFSLKFYCYILLCTFY